MVSIGVRYAKNGYTIIELMVTIVIVSVLAATLGVAFVKLLNIQEREREEAYVREKLADICGEYADKLSIGSSIISTSTNATIVKYRQETGGVSLETGLVTRVAYLSLQLSPTNDTVDMGIFSFENQDLIQKTYSLVLYNQPLLQQDHRDSLQVLLLTRLDTLAHKNLNGHFP